MLIISANASSENKINLLGIENEFIIQFEDGNLYGNITYPKVHDINTPVIIIVSDLGNFDRNGKINTNKNNYYKKLAYQLSNNGIITIRYDKRGIGESVDLVENKTPSISQHKDDLIQILNYINKKMGRRDNKIYLLGHSDGSLIVSLAAQQRNLSGLIFYSLQATKQKDIIKERLEKDNKLLYENGQLNDKAILIDTFNDLLSAIENDNKFIIKDKNIPKRYENLFLSLYYQKQYSKELLNLDPLKLIKKQNSPSLIINGKEDESLTESGINELKELNNHKIQWYHLDELKHFLLTKDSFINNRVLNLTLSFIYKNN
jgi:alpha/beta superfamily hydrolase